MGLDINRAGINYRDNLIDPLLSFNTSQTWTVSSGTGSAGLDNNTLYEGDSSLKIINTDPTNDLVVTNSVQSSVIPYDGDFRLSFYMRKDEPLEFMTLEVVTFQNASPFNTQTFVLDTDAGGNDIDGIFQRFAADVDYNFTKGDDITFTFNLKGKAGTLLLNTTVWVDAMQLEAVTTNNKFPSQFKLPRKTLVGAQLFGVYNYNDDVTATTPINLINGSWVHVTNDGIGTNTFLGGAFSDITPYNIVTGNFEFSELELFDSIDIRLDTIITTSSANEFVEARIMLSLGSLDIPLTFVSETFKSAGTYPLFGSIKVVLYTELVRAVDARIECLTDGGSSTLEVNGWSMQVNKRVI